MSELEVRVDQGVLRGCSDITDDGFKYKKFLGIPYAKPPVGELRFKNPQPAEPWQGVLDATEEREACAQIDKWLFKTYVGSEDCLYLNIFVPEEKKGPLPVMFWIHGGGFTEGSSNSHFYGPDFIVSKDVIFVSINYRLGPLGFLSMCTKDIPGNAGLKDQLMALKWVNRNIHNFGGDPKNITIFGESAGSFSVDLMMICESADGLYQKAICQSGVGTNIWGYQREPEKYAFQLAAVLGLNTTDKNEAISFMKACPVEDLVAASASEAFSVKTHFYFCPCVEEDAPGAFLTMEPEKALQERKFNKVPTIYGFNSKEGVLFLSQTLLDLKPEVLTLEMLIPDFTAFIPFELKSVLGSEKCEAIASKIKEFYFCDSNVLDNFINLMSDVMFINGINAAVSMRAISGSPVYFYEFSYYGALNLLRLSIPLSYGKAAHADDLGYLFKPTLTHKDIPKELLIKVEKLNPGPDDFKVRKMMTEMWTNFAKFSNPTPHVSDDISTLWEPATSDTLNCLLIDKDLTLVQNPVGERLRFWRTLFKS